MRNPVHPHTLPLWLVVASFGPYVLMGASLRTEHLLVYGLLPLAVLLLPFQRRSVLVFPPLAAAIVLLVFVTFWTLVVTLVGPPHYESLGKVVAHFENYLQPIAVVLVLAAFVKPRDTSEALRLFRNVCRVLIWLLIGNTLVATTSIFFDLSGPLQRFVGPPSADGLTVWELAAQMGRFSGIFNQPMESGLTYSLGLFAWAYLVRQKTRPTSADYVVLGLLLLGGVLSVSKVFILGGFPLFVLYWLSLSRLRQLLSSRLALVTLAAAGSLTALLERWIGLEYFLRLFLPGQSGDPNLLFLYTAGRFGDQGTLVKGLYTRVWQEAPLQGLGFASATTLDNGYIEFLFQGGLVALAGYLALLAVMGWIGLKQYLQGQEEGRLLLCCLVFVVGAGIGAPVLTINRFSTVFWVFFVALCHAAHLRGRESLAAETYASLRSPVLAASS